MSFLNSVKNMIDTRVKGVKFVKGMILRKTLVFSGWVQIFLYTKELCAICEISY